MNQLQELNLPFSILVCGKPRTGKSHIIRYLLYLFTSKRDIYKRFSYGLVFCKTSFNSSYNFVPSQWVYRQYDPDALRNLMNIQANIREQGYVPPFVFDCLDGKQFKSDLFKDLIQNYRHYSICPIISTQYINRIETVNRECASNAIVFRQYTKNALEAIYNSFGQRFDSLQEFKDYLYKNTGNYNFVFVDNESISV